MNIIKTLGFAAVAALSLGVGAAMAQEGANATNSGAAYFGPQGPAIQAPYTQHGSVQSGSSDFEMRPANPQWTPGVPYSNEAGQG
jgi:hypothetical protein